MGGGKVDATEFISSAAFAENFVIQFVDLASRYARGEIKKRWIPCLRIRSGSYLDPRLRAITDFLTEEIPPTPVVTGTDSPLPAPAHEARRAEMARRSH
jgi:hypothetical protein